jgi:hypothetical protein
MPTAPFSRRWKLALGLSGALLAPAAAYGYLSSPGASAPGPVRLTASVVAGMSPGATGAVSFTAANPSGSPLLVDTVHLVRVTVDRLHAACDTDAFRMGDVVESVEVAAGAASQALPNRGSLSFRDTGENQDGCKGAVLTLFLSSS